MYSIGIFSKINRITTKTLRHYDEIGLLKPEHVDELTGYRYYTTDQLPKLHKIITLKQMGLSLQDIKDVIENPKLLEVFLKLKEHEIIKNIKEEEMKLNQIKTFSNMINSESIPIYTPVIKELPEVIVASRRLVLSGYGILFNYIIENEIKKLGCKVSVPQYCFNIYHDGEYKETDIDVEVCEAVTELRADTDLIKFKVLNKVDTAVCVLHKGSYDKLREAYIFALNWIEENNYEIIDYPRESYIDGVWNKENEEDWLTEIQVPVKIK